MSSRASHPTSSATETLNILYDLSQLLNTQLDRDTLATCVKMIEGGANPEALAAVVKELRRENATLAAQVQVPADER